MKKIILSTLVLFSVFSVLIIVNVPNQGLTVREKHEYYLKNNPFKNVSHLTEKERKSLGIPPNKYYEDEWVLTMNPYLGRPTTENLFDINQDIKSGRYVLQSSARSVPGDENNFWVERGPNNVGGRTKALLFDPKDTSHETVFAGGISGGLWKNTNISNVSSNWGLVDVDTNLPVSCITADPNNSDILYIGTGESYTYGDGIGNGVWKSTDGGATWAHIFGGFDGAAEFQSDALLTVNTPASIAGDYAGVSASFGPTLTTISGNLVLVNDGTTTPTLGCADLTNASAINGSIAVIQRGSCLFVEKVRYAQNAGAIAVLMINNVSGQPIAMGGDNAEDITIPSIMISQADGLQVMNEMASNTVNVTFAARESMGNGIFLIPGKSHINDIIAVNNAGNTEIYAAVGDSYYGNTSSPLTVYGSGDVGVYKSTDGGISWTRLSIPSTSTGDFYVPVDLEYSSNNTLWVSTTNSVLTGEGGGAIFSSPDHLNLTLKYEFADGGRTEVAISKSNPNLLYAVSDLTNSSAPFISIIKTTDAFNSITSLGLPNDNYSGIPDNDFSNGQSWYDLAIEVNPTNDQIVYVGGINWFKSTNGGTTWLQFSNSYGGALPNIHPDQHSIAFANDNILLIGNDGGVAYSNDGGSTISHRNANYNVTQFYHMGVAPTTSFSGEYFLAGAQDNGSQLFPNAPNGVSSSTEVQGGDGAYCFFDQDGTDKYYITNYIYNRSINLYNYNTGNTITVNSESTENGDFICQETLDSKLNYLYTNYTAYNSSTDVTTYQIRRYRFFSITGSGLINKTTLTNSLLTSSPTAMKVSPYTTTSTTLLLGLKNGKILKLTNANTTPVWTDLSSSNIVGSISDIEFGQSESELLVTVYNYGVKSVWYSSDGGTTWSEKEGNLPDMPIRCILQNPLRPEQVLLGTELGTWWTQDFYSTSPTWYYGSNGMNSVKVTDLQMRNDYKVFAATYGRGVFSGQFTSADGTVGIDDNSYDNKSIIYPNPATDYTVFKSSVELVNPVISIFDTNGRLIKTLKYESKGTNYKITTTNLNSGVYVVKIKSGDITINKKLIISK